VAELSIGQISWALRGTSVSNSLITPDLEQILVPGII